MSAAELLRGLDKDAKGGPWRSSVYMNAVLDSANDPIAYVGNADTRHAITITRNLLPLLAGLVEAVEKYALSLKESVDVDACSPLTRTMIAASDALNAAAAKEVG